MLRTGYQVVDLGSRSIGTTGYNLDGLGDIMKLGKPLRLKNLVLDTGEEEPLVNCVVIRESNRYLIPVIFDTGIQYLEIKGDHIKKVTI